MRIRVKICGISRPEWAVAAAEAGADAIGLIFAPSPRRVTPGQAARIVDALPPWVSPVGVFVDSSAEEVLGIAAEVGLAAVQLHGQEPPQVLGSLGRLKVIKAIRLATEADLDAAHKWRRAAESCGRLPDAWLVDARVPGGPPGGTGRRADWPLAARMIEEGFRPLILAGGLAAGNVAEAIRAVRPWGVEGNSGVEVSPGVKDVAMIRAFVEQARSLT